VKGANEKIKKEEKEKNVKDGSALKEKNENERSEKKEKEKNWKKENESVKRDKHGTSVNSTGFDSNLFSVISARLTPGFRLERIPGGKPTLSDLYGAIFAPQSMFQIGEVVLVPRSRGGFTYGKVTLCKQRQAPCSALTGIVPNIVPAV